MDRARKERRRESDSIAVDAGRNPSIETSFSERLAAALKWGGGESAGLVSMQQRSGEIESDTARLLPGGGESYFKIGCADISSHRRWPEAHN